MERINTADEVVKIFPIVIANPIVIADGVVTTDPIVRVDAVDSIVTVERNVAMDELALCPACVWNRHSKQADAKVGVAIPVSLAQHVQSQSPKLAVAVN